MSSAAKYRSRSIEHRVVAFSMSGDPADLLSRGFGMDHLRELIIRLARPILRQGASLSYGGFWRETPENFTFDFLRLIKAEQEDYIPGSPDAAPVPAGILYNHSAWPNYLEVTPGIEAQWINCCRIVRTSQEDAGITPDDRVADSLAEREKVADRTLFNAAVCLSAMRHRMAAPAVLSVAELFHQETIPPVAARILFGGRLNGYRGFMPGLFEEALIALKHGHPLYLLGGFGGSTGALAQALLAPATATVTSSPAGRRRKAPDSPMPDPLRMEYHLANTPDTAILKDLTRSMPFPASIPRPAAAWASLQKVITAARGNLAAALNTGLSESDTRRLLVTSDLNEAVRLVRDGLRQRLNLSTVAA